MIENRDVLTTRRVAAAGSGCSECILRLDEFGQFDRQLAIIAKLYDLRGDLVEITATFAEIERNLIFPEAKLSMNISNDNLYISTDSFARFVELSGDMNDDGFGWLFDDNYFDMIPGIEKKVKILRSPSSGVITAKSHFSPYVTNIQYK